MVSRRTNRLLNKISHHTNIYQPFSKYISGELYPTQDRTKLGKLVSLKYINKYKSDIKHISDSPDIYEFTPEPYIDGVFVGNIITQDFIVLRYDITEPYYMIAISDDYNAMIVGDSRNYENVVHKYPQQLEEYLGLMVINHYCPSTYIRSVVLACDSTEPCNSVIAEFYADSERSDYVRFIIDTEVESIILDRYDPDRLRDYNGRGPLDNSFYYLDINGFGVRNQQSAFINVNGGYPDPLQDMYRTDILNKEEVIELRKRLLAERIIYG